MTVQINDISVLSNRKSEILSDFKIQMGQLTHLRQIDFVIVNKENKMIKETEKKWGKILSLCQKTDKIVIFEDNRCTR